MSQLFSRQTLLWALLLVASLSFSGFLLSEGFPAAFLVGSMISGILLTLTGEKLVLPRRLFQTAQSLIGCTVASSITGAILGTICRNWAEMLAIVLSVVVAGGLVGWALVRTRMLPGTTAAWGSTPGAASAMVAMAEAYGADVRLVALMQYLRVLIVVLTATLVSHYLLGPRAISVPAPVEISFRLDEEQAFLLLNTLAIALIGGVAGARLRIPAGAMMVPMVLGAILHASDLADLYVPFWLPAAASVLLGWYVGLGFNRKLLVSAARMLPRLLISAVFLIALCAFAAWLMVRFTTTDPLTAYLATSPGGLDSVVLIAIGSQADIPFVVAVQTLRLFTVILLGPGIARLICRYAD